MADISFLLQPVIYYEAVMSQVIIQHEDRRPGVLDVWVHLLLEELQEVLLVGGLGERPMHLARL